MAWGKTVVVVTGASRGIGAAVCERLAPHLGIGSVIIGVARDETNLERCKSCVKEANPSVAFISVQQDLSSLEASVVQHALAQGFEEALRSPGGALSTALMVHNAGSLGDVIYTKDLNNFAEVSKYYDLNVSSVVVLNAAFLSLAKVQQAATPSMTIKVVNISSICALEPFKSWSLYCSGKAARDMFFRVLAAEEPSVTVLSYAPGPVDTAMQKEARTNTADVSLRESFIAKFNAGETLTASQTVDKMISLLESGAFTSGGHVDYYDV
ncbi:sepiapterin reductase-like [Hyalella azteca]|uniref:Sepiapterin reductase n=1 Tax=Hyalella azteca TaxID=294128 RepID=A0A8B7NMH8_HYAAZ|nr:sepiapterin reductase-like [Hyalella azteca]XP_018014872.1 sepiapterin reductase-like [Hyalella azteca]XP_018014873.1 sepiapterin reductase-like [Hyalella azteca]